MCNDAINWRINCGFVHKKNKNIDVLCLSETWHENSHTIPVRRLRAHGFQVLERARHFADSVCTSSGNFINLIMVD